MYEDGSDRRFGKAFPEAWQRIRKADHGQFMDAGGLFTFVTLYPLEQAWQSSTGSDRAFTPSDSRISSRDYYWKLLSHLPPGRVNPVSRENLRRFVILDLFALAVLAIVSWFLARANIQRRQAGEARTLHLRESETRLKTMLHSIQAGVMVVDVKTRTIVDINPAALNIIGNSKEQVLGRVCHRFISPAHERECPVVDLGQAVDSSERTLIKANGEEVPILKTVTPIRLDGKACLLESFLELTEKKKLEAQLQQAGKLEAIATLAGGIAHEFNNALMGVMGNMELLKMELSGGERQDGYFAAMTSSVHRMSRLTDQLLAYARGGRYQPKDLRLDEFVMETLPILQHDLTPEVRVETHFEKVSVIKADHAQIQMALFAILTNSNEALEEGGLIRITAENKDIDADFAQRHPGLKPGPHVCLTIEDNGKGMDEETKTRIFEPFFTTRFQGRGMGMAAVYGIVMNHDGWITVDSQPGKGTIVRIYLPAVNPENTIKDVKPPALESAAGEGTILIIEDEDIVVEVTRAMLEMLGYRVMIAGTGKEAVHMVENFHDRIDLALLDIKLPDMEGGKIYPLMKKAHPGLKVIVFSGYAIDGPARNILDSGAEGFIHKPFSLATLAAKLKQVLEM